MELGSLFQDQPWNPDRVSPDDLVEIMSRVRRKDITNRSGKRILSMIFEGDQRTVQDIVAEEKLQLTPLSRQEYLDLAQKLINEKPDMVKDIVQKGQAKKVMWFVGQMIARSSEGSVEPDKAEAIVKEQLGLGEPS
jgi:aspartyl-tRNA(Asn)/glutamyl-tRNA(Gln) amidotransferase subunit B